MEVSGQAHLGQDDAFHRRHVTDVTSAPRFQWREAGAEGTSPVESVTLSKNPGACLVNANAAVDMRKNCICPERGHGRLSSSSARHRRRVVDAADPPGAVNVASETPSAASSSSSHAAASASAAHAPDGPVALLASEVIRKLRVDHRLETECTLGRAWCQRRGVGKCRGGRDSRICRWGEKGGAFWGGVALGLGAYRGTHNATMRFTTLQNISVSMLGRIRVRRSTTEPVEGVRGRMSREGESVVGCWARRLIRGGAGEMGSRGRTRGARVMRGVGWTRGCVPLLT